MISVGSLFSPLNRPLSFVLGILMLLGAWERRKQGSVLGALLQTLLGVLLLI